MGGSLLSKAEVPGSSPWAIYPRNFLASYLVSMVSRVLWSPEGLVEVRVSWPGPPRYQKKKKHGVLHQTLCVDKPSHNGVAERKNRHFLETTQALLIQMNVPKHF